LHTPLAVICAAGENLADGVIQDLEQAKKYGSLIRTEGRRLARMVSSILEFADLKSSYKTYQRHPVRIGDLIEKALAACQLPISEGGFTVEKKIQANLPLVMGDADALRRSIQNLLENAMKYSGDSRWVGIEVQSLEGPRGYEVQIIVRDRGLGITPSEVLRIFKPFYRSQQVIDAQISGTGLGLGLVKHIIDGHDGQLLVNSCLGRGSTFTIQLPAFSPASQQNEPVEGGEYEQSPTAH
jgi:signal transduction histidine kinase